MTAYLPINRRHIASTSLNMNVNSLQSKLSSLQALESSEVKLDEQGIFSKLLRPPSAANIKITRQTKKYQPKFKKPDVQNLIQEGNTLKLEKMHDKKVIMGLKLKIQELQKKVRKIENVNTEFMKAMDQQGNSSVYIEILKKKMHDLNVKYLNAEAQIRQLKKLPNASIYEENNIEKQYLLSETIRLKAFLSSIQRNDDQKTRFQDQFLRMLKQENQKLKSTIRLLQNDKILLKSRQSIQSKLTNDLKKEIEQLKQKSILKESQIDKLNNENKDLLFKKANQFQKQQERRQSEEVNRLAKSIEELKQQKKKIMEVNNQLQEDHSILKEKQKLKSTELSEMERKYELQIKNCQQQLEQLQFENGNYKNDYFNLLNNETLKKKKSKVDSIVPQKSYYKPVKIDQLEVGLFSLDYLIKNRNLLSLENLLPLQKTQLKCHQIINILQEKPVQLNKKEALKMARYLVQDNTEQKIAYDPNALVDRSLAITILRSALNKTQQCISQKVVDRWRCLIQKAKRLIPSLENSELEFISRTKFCELLSKNIRSQIDKQEIHYVMLKSFSFEETDCEVMMSVDLLMRTLNQFLSAKTPAE